MVAEVQEGTPLRVVARRYGVSVPTVRWWTQRASDLPLESVDFSSRRGMAGGAARRVPPQVERAVLELRSSLREKSDLGEYGGVAIRDALEGMVASGQLEVVPEVVPAVATINRILGRHGLLDGRKRIRRDPPPPGWYLPELPDTELDSADFVEGLKIKNGPLVDVLNVVSLHGGLVNSWPDKSKSAERVRASLLEHWKEYGAPGYAQFDNDTCFEGPHQHADVISSVMRMCLACGVTPIFAPPQETGFQAAVESYNGRWQAKVWARYHFDSLEHLKEQSLRYVQACHRRNAQRIEAAPARKVVPQDWQPDLLERPKGRIIYLRRTSQSGTVHMLGQDFEVDATWQHRLVRAEVDLLEEQIRFFALRRREPTQQPLLAEKSYKLKHK